MAKEYIERDALIEQIQFVYCDECYNYNGVRCRACNFDDAISVIVDQPAADVTPVVHGEWIKHLPDPDVMRKFHAMGIGKSMGERSIFWTCSNCNMWGMPHHKYCQNCGARMDGGKHGDG